MHVLDYWGSLLLAGAVVALLLAFLHGGETYGWFGPETVAMYALSAGLLALFVVVERGASEPVLPLSLFGNRVIAVSSIAVFVAGAVAFGVTSYVPLFEQGVFGGSATEAGMVLAPMSVTWVGAAMLSGRLILRAGYFPAAMTGGVLLFLGSLLLLGLTEDTSILIAIVATSIIGAGMGFATNSTIIAVQNAVDWSQRGVATASTQFFRTIGGSISIAIMGALLNTRMAERLGGIEGVPDGDRAEALLDPAQRGELAAQVIEAMRSALAVSLQEMFLVVFIAGAACLVVIWFFPRGLVSDLSAREAVGSASPET
jgi:MFS family permease